MPQIAFYKYQGTGNDFIFIDNRLEKFPVATAIIQKLCDRRLGIGADGIVLIQNHSEYDFEMIYFNPDASQSFCGNASRCAVHFAHELGIIHDSTHFLAIDGPHQASIKDGLVYLKMNDVNTIERPGNAYFINTGSPHYITFVDQIDETDVYKEGKSIRNSKPYQEKGVNVNFVQQLPENQVYVRTYERGVENETLSCGTGVTAAALAVSLEGYTSPVKIMTKGGALEIAFDRLSDTQFTNIFLIGPAVKVFSGLIEV